MNLSQFHLLQWLSSGLPIKEVINTNLFVFNLRLRSFICKIYRTVRFSSGWWSPVFFADFMMQLNSNSSLNAYDKDRWQQQFDKNCKVVVKIPLKTYFPLNLLSGFYFNQNWFYFSMCKTIIPFKKKLHYKPRIYNRKSYLEPTNSIDK